MDGMLPSLLRLRSRHSSRHDQKKEISTKGKPAPKKRQESSSSSSSSSEASSSDSSSESSSDEDEPVITKAVFVPKHKRNLVRSEEEKWQEEERKLQLEKEREEKRKMESRALVAKQLAEAELSMVEEDQDEEAGGATNPPPNDDDELEPEKARDAWELRELDRLLRDIDEIMAQQRDQEEYNRRKNMTDAECLEEDIKAGRYQAPGDNRRNPAEKGNIQQRFYHRGAYYMDSTEWGEDDVRQKAAEYAKAATGDDKIDKSKLPKVMQVKQFGRANQTKYSGLAAEDTTDKSTRFLPLVQGSKKKKNDQQER